MEKSVSIACNVVLSVIITVLFSQLEQSVSVACNVDLSVINYSAFFSNGAKRLSRLQCGFVRYNYSAFHLQWSQASHSLAMCVFVRYIIAALFSPVEPSVSIACNVGFFPPVI